MGRGAQGVGALSPEQVARFRSDGFLVIEHFASPEEVAAMLRRAEELVDAFDPSTVSSVFSTTDQKKTSDAYFLDSGNHVSFFFEEKAGAPLERRARPTRPASRFVGSIPSHRRRATKTSFMNELTGARRC